MADQAPGPSGDSDLKRITTEASWLLSAFDESWLDLAEPIGLFVDRQGGKQIASRGELQRWMQDAQGWGIQALRACERPAGLYRDQVRVDPTLKAAGQAVTKSVADDAPQAVHDAIAHYVAQVSGTSP